MRRLFQFRLRTLFVVMTLAALGCAITAYGYREYLRQQELNRAFNEGY